jgi:hypothetical protein
VLQLKNDSKTHDIVLQIAKGYGATLLAQKNCPDLLALHEAKLEEQRKMIERQEGNLRIYLNKCKQRKLAQPSA